MKKQITRILAGLTAFLITISATGIAATANEMPKTNRAVSMAESKSFRGILKDETVYIIADANGESQKVIVSDWIKNPNGVNEISDSSILKDIENVKGNEEFSQNGDKLLWNADGNDIYYRGTTNEQVPVSVKITYYLDGEELSPDEIKGKSGKVKIKIDYINNIKKTTEINGEKIEMTVPFLMGTGMILDNNVFSNVEITNGKIISDGNRSIAVGYAMPGLEDALGLNDIEKDSEKNMDIEIPESVEITADVKDFSLMTTMSVATNSIWNDIDLDNADSIDDLKNSLSDLSSASNKLVDGTSDLYDGVKALLDGSDSLTEGIDKLSDGGKSLENGSKKLSKGASSLKGGSKDLYKGVKSAKAGADKLYTGIDSLNKGAKKLKTGTSDLKTGSSKLKTGASDLKNGTHSAYTSTKDLVDGANSLNAGLKTANDGALKLKTGSQDFVTGVGKIKDGAKDLSTGISDLNDGLAQTKEGVEQSIAANEQVLAGLKKLVDSSPSNQEYNKMYQTLKTTIDGQKKLLLMLDSNTDGGLKNGAEKLLKGSQALVSGIEDEKKGLEAGAKELSKGASDLSDGVLALYGGSETLYTGTKSLYTGLGKLDTGAGTLKSGADDLYNGADKLKTGANDLYVGSGKLKTGSKDLTNGLLKLKKGSKKLKSGTSTLAEGTNSLYDGAMALNKGLVSLNSGSEELIVGVEALKDGAKQVRDGMFKFDDEGISKIVDLFDGNLSSVIDRFKALSDISKEYKSFSGIDNKTDGSVKFIIKTDEIKNEE